jgi:hypothetical protein
VKTISYLVAWALVRVAFWGYQTAIYLSDVRLFRGELGPGGE